MQTATSQFQYVQEWDDEFLLLFPHRFDYIWAEHREPGIKVEWKTENRHPLSDRLIRQGAYLYGVRFGAETSYGLLDIDIGSPYHPKQDPFALPRIIAALEPLGLVRSIACSSSYSGGLHVYLPFQQAQSSWQLAIALAALLENAGFKLCPGHLEVFPNSKPYTVDGTPSLFNAHRLPLQTGSYLLNEDFQPIWTSQKSFIQQWHLAQQCNDIAKTTLKQILKQAKRRQFHISGKAEKFINDLNTEIELGWTGYGQTNRLLGRITMREYIFHHVLSGGEPLEGAALIAAIVETAQSLPGYRDWCRHQHELEQRTEEWVRCIENSRYFHYGDPSGKFKAKEIDAAIEQLPSWNQRQSEATRDRIRRAIADLLEQGTLPSRATARFRALLQYNIGGGSLYRHRDLWHPSYLVGFDVSAQSNEIPPNPPTTKDSQLDCVEDASNWHNHPSLLPTTDGDMPASNDFDGLTASINEASGSNLLLPLESGNSELELSQGIQYVQQVLFDLKAQQEARQEAARTAQQHQQRIKQEASETRHVVRMQQYLASGDPILVAEALAWAQVNHGILDLSVLQCPPVNEITTHSGASRRLKDLAAITIQVERLGLTQEQVRDRLRELFGKPSQTLLDDLELGQWRLWLDSR